ncbi:DNA internalization-related competence protein ComEC/Rec2 [uncultured Amphritea sp.]|uniref:DNA internalization-related competence protein ComEC/Rec2 n=1 Tax=uncultured Amphritea sp. TaxID=981605 RepID=UPI002610E257|nr:DNA internalization-related competence protein ComEC/Rec2 [uncultured Amphritea sp.]
MIGIAFGVLLVACLPQLLSYSFLTILSVALLLCFMPVSGRWLAAPVRIQIAGLLFGTVFASGWGYLNLSQRMPMYMSAQELNISGTVSRLPEYRPGMVRFNFEVDQYSPLMSGVDLQHLQLNWYNPEREIIPGQQWAFRVRLKPPRGLMNPGGSDYETQLFANRVNARGYLLTARLIDEAGAGSRYRIEYLRYRLGQWLTQLSLGPDADATIRALVLGDKQDLSDQQWQVLRQTGTVHLVVISGLHIAIACMLGYWAGWLFQWPVLWLAGRYAPELVDVRACRIIPALVMASGYALLAGFSIPTQRALIMAVAMLLPPLLNRHLGVWKRYQLALVLVLLMQPLSFFQPGFWLSFAAVAALLLAVSETGEKRRIRTIFATQWSVFIGLFPLLLLWLGQVALFAPLVNLVAIPLLSFILIPGVLLGMLLCLVDADTGAVFLSGLSDTFWWLLQLCMPPEGVGLFTSRPSLMTVFLGVLAAVLLNLPRWTGMGYFSLFILTVLIFQPKPSIEHGDFRTTVVDIGQGLAVLLETRNKVLLFDTGAAFRGSSTARFTLLPLLESRNISHLDRVIISHKDNDHAGGYPSLAAAFVVAELNSGSPAVRRSDAAKPCVSGDTWEWDGIRFSYIQPVRPVPVNENNRSCVLLVQSKNCSVLIPGDIESGVEQQILSDNPGLQVDWLVAAHHGSRFSSSHEWLAALKPEWVLFSAGFDNSYGHPAVDVIERLRHLQLNWLNTSEKGALMLQSTAGRCLTEGYRDTKMRYWLADKAPE